MAPYFASFGSQPSTSAVQEITSTSQFDSLLSSSTVLRASGRNSDVNHGRTGGPNAVVAQFYSDTCGPCQRIKGPFENVANEYLSLGPGVERRKIATREKEAGVAFVKINTASNGELSQRYSIKYIPSFGVFVDGKLAEMKTTGDEGEVRALISRHITNKSRSFNRLTSSIFESSVGRRLGGSDHENEESDPKPPTHASRPRPATGQPGSSGSIVSMIGNLIGMVVSMFYALVDLVDKSVVWILPIGWMSRTGTARSIVDAVLLFIFSVFASTAADGAARYERVKRRQKVEFDQRRARTLASVPPGRS